MLSDGVLQYKTTIGFNKDQHLHKNTTCLEHPECPNRIEECRAILRDSGLLHACQEVEDFPALDDLDLRQSHSEGHVNKLLKEAISMNQEALNRLCEDYDSVFMTPHSVEVAKSAVSCCRWLAESIVEEKIPNAFALVRPPGHHAGPSSACGFCLFNNAAQAAEAAFNFGADRILIVDLDVHHGNGTQQIFYEDNRVLYFSVHRYQAGNFWPHLRESDFDHIGIHEGTGYNVNVPLNEVGCGDADYMAIFWNVLWPLASQFNPDFVVVSAGFDSCEGDPLGEMRLSPDVYSHFIYHLSALASGKLLAILEGGYNHSIEAMGVYKCVRVLTGHTPLPLEISEHPKASTVESCLNCISALRGFWSCFDFYNTAGSMKGFEWNVHQPSIVFTPPRLDNIKNTGAVDQESLVRSGKDFKASATTKTLIIHNGDTATHANSTDDDHPERPERTIRIMEELKKRGLLSKCDVVENKRLASDGELEAVHERPYIRRMKNTTKLSESELRVTEDGVNSIFLTHDTFHIACRAAGAVLENFLKFAKAFSKFLGQLACV
uniref:Histone deacetylase superfamily domain containing protein n=1 Tax=Haemonchus contortus TaxID=6289 RepID=W6NCP5_HAECO